MQTSRDMPEFWGDLETLLYELKGETADQSRDLRPIQPSPESGGAEPNRGASLGTKKELHETTVTLKC